MINLGIIAGASAGLPFPVMESRSSGFGASSLTHSTSLPSGIQLGDVLTATIVLRRENTTPATTWSVSNNSTTGWFKIADRYVGNVTYSVTLSVWAKVATASETVAPEFLLSGANAGPSAWSIERWSGAIGIPPLMLSPLNASNPVVNPTNSSTSPFTPTMTESVVYTVAGGRNNNTTTSIWGLGAQTSLDAIQLSNAWLSSGYENVYDVNPRAHRITWNPSTSGATIVTGAMSVSPRKSRTVYSVAGTTAIVVPKERNFMWADGWGAGGGGGGANYLNSSGGGGAGGSRSLGVAIPVTPDETLNVVVGTGGASGLAGNNGIAGGDSEIWRGPVGTGTCLWRAKGGPGGAPSGGAGGVATTTGAIGDHFIIGSNGLPGAPGQVPGGFGGDAAKPEGGNGSTHMYNEQPGIPGGGAPGAYGNQVANGFAGGIGQVRVSF